MIEFFDNFQSLTEEVFPVLELPKEIDRALDPSLTSGLPTVVVRGFLNYMTIVDGVVIKFTKSTQIKPTATHSFPILLIPTSVESTTAIVKSTALALSETDLMVELNKRTGQIQVSPFKPNELNSSLISSQRDVPDAGHRIPLTENRTSNPLSASEKLRVSVQ